MCFTSFVIKELRRLSQETYITAIASPKIGPHYKVFISSFGYSGVLKHPFQSSLLNFLRKNKKNWMKLQQRGRKKANRKKRNLGRRRQSYMVIYFLCLFIFTINFHIFGLFSVHMYHLPLLISCCTSLY